MQEAALALMQENSHIITNSDSNFQKRKSSIAMEQESSQCLLHGVNTGIAPHSSRGYARSEAASCLR